MRNMKIRKAVQKGFTLLELLVVITILAILATGALLAYEGLTDTAQGAAAANNTVTADQSIRNFKAVTGNYPNQWDHLVTDDGVGGAGGDPLAFVSNTTYSFLAKVDASALSNQIQNAFLRVGVDEIQVRTTSAITAGVEPNLQHNEGAVQAVGAGGTTLELELGDDGEPENFFNRLVIVPAAQVIDPVAGTGGTFCTVGGVAPQAIVGTIDPVAAANFLNKVNDAFEPDTCNLVAAFGFGNDAAKSTTGSPVAIASAPTYSSRLINPATTYARYIALFHLGKTDNADITANDIFRKPVLIGVLDSEGKLVDQNIAVANTTTQ